MLAFATYGDEEATPCVFIAGAACGRVLHAPSWMDEGHCMVSFDRPGLGDSTRDPAKSFASVAADVRALVTSLGRRQVKIIAHSQGAPFGLACALAGIASDVTLVSPSDEVAYPPIFAQLPSGLQELVDLAQLDPDAARAILAGFDGDAMFEMVMQSVAPSDAAVFDDPTFVARYRAALADGFRQGAVGYVQDTLLAMRPWALPLDQIDVPVAIWFGADDVVHSPDLGETLAQRIPGARRTVVDGVGSSLLWSTRAR